MEPEEASRLRRRADEITGRLAEIDKQVASERERLRRAAADPNDAVMGNILIAGVYDRLGKANPTGARGPDFQLEQERARLSSELAQVRDALAKIEGSS